MARAELIALLDEEVVDRPRLTLAYMHRYNLAGPVIDRLASHPLHSFPDRQAWAAHLKALGIAALEVTPDPVQIASQGAM